jgi:hypothetical protein
MRIWDSFIPIQTAVTNFTSSAIPTGDNGNVAVGVTITGADVVGTLSLQAAFTQDFARPFLIQTATAVTASADTLINLTDINYPYVRVVWVYTSGTGNLTVDVSIRQQILNRGG